MQEDFLHVCRCSSRPPPLQASAQKELEESWQVYAELQRMVEQSQAELVEAIATKQREAERHAQELARGLENELSQLKRRSSELEAHAQMKDRVLFLQVRTSNLVPQPRSRRKKKKKSR